MHRLRFVALLLAVGFLSGGFLMGEDKKAAKETSDVKVRLPNYYKQLKLSSKQKKDIYTIRRKYAVQIKKLQQQLDDLREQEKKEVESILTEKQKTQLTGITAKVAKDRANKRKKKTDDEEKN